MAEESPTVDQEPISVHTTHIVAHINIRPESLFDVPVKAVFELYLIN